MILAIFESVFDKRARAMPVPIYGMRRTRPNAFSGTALKAILFSILTLITSGAVLAMFLFHIFISEEPFTITDPLKDIRVAIKHFDKKRFVGKLSTAEQTKLASQVKFVSEIIGRTNRLADRKELALSIVSESMKAHVDPLFVAAVVKSESTFKVLAVSNKGARGLMQLLPQTARYAETSLSKSAEGGSRKSIHHIDYNLQLGITYLKHLQDTFSGNKELALIAYNWGPGNLLNALRNRSEIPLETKKYARKILNTHKLWQQELLMNARADQVVTKELA